MFAQLMVAARSGFSLVILVSIAGCELPTDAPKQGNPRAPGNTVLVPTVIPMFAVTQDVDVTSLGAFSTTGIHVAQAVNMRGHVVGSSTNGSGNLRAFYWTPSGGMVDLGTTGGTTAQANDINDQNMVTGYSVNASGVSELFTWTPSGGMQARGTFGGSKAKGFGVNNDGVVVGNYELGVAQVRDEFTTIAYTGNNGSRNWTGPWQESGESDGTNAGILRVLANARCSAGNCIRIGHADIEDQPLKFLFREANLTGASSATLTYNFNAHDQDGKGTVYVRVSGNGGASWTTLATYGPFSGSGSASFDVTPYIAANTRVRVDVTGKYAMYLYVDNVQIQYVRNGEKAFVWTSAGGFSEIQGGALTYANDINNNGQVIGVTRASALDPYSMFVWHSSTGWQGVGPMSASHIEHVAFRINEFGTIAGGALNFSTFRYDPITWHPQTGYTDLRTLGFETPRSGLTYGINNLGHMGLLILNDDGTRTPAVWVKGTGTVELPSLGGQDGEIWAINDLGMVVGWSQDASGNMLPAKWQVMFAPVERTQDAIDVLQAIADTTSNPSNKSKLEAAIAKGAAAVTKFQQNPPDNQGALGELEGAVDELATAVSLGAINPEIGGNLLEVLTQAARDAAEAAIDAATARGGDPVKIADAQAQMGSGDSSRNSGQYKDAVAKYKSALALAEGA